MHDPNLQLLEAAAQLLEPLLDDVVFVGGCVTGLLITDAAAADMRPTTDVDVIAEVYSYAEYGVLSHRLRELGLTEDDREDAPTCRWRHGNLAIDVMPIDEGSPGVHQSLVSTSDGIGREGRSLRVDPTMHYARVLCCNQAGSISRTWERRLFWPVMTSKTRSQLSTGDGNWPTSSWKHRRTYRGYIRDEFTQLLGTGDFIDALPGFLLPDEANQARLSVLRARLEALAS